MSFVAKIRELPTPEIKLMSEVISVCKLILVNRQQVHMLKDRFPLPKIENMVSFNNDTRAIYQLDNIKQAYKKEQTNTLSLL